MTFDDVVIVAVPAGETVHLDYPQPVVVPNDTPAGTWCLDMGPFLTNADGSDGRISITGYTV